MSNPQKSQLKMLIAHELGADIEDAYEREMAAAHQLEGGVEALKQAALKVPSELAKRVDQELGEGESFKDGMSRLEVAELVKKYLARAGVFLAHLATNESTKIAPQRGKAEGMKSAVELIAKAREAESVKLQEALALVEEGPRPVPAMNAARAERGSAAERRAAEAEKKTAKKPRKKRAAKKASG